MIKNFISFFIEQGAIFSDGDKVSVFWGNLEAQAERPLTPAIYAPDFYLEDSKPWKLFRNHQQLDKSDFFSLIKNELTTGGLNNPLVWSEPNKDALTQQFIKIQRAFQNQGYHKVVPCVFANGQSALTSQQVLTSILQNLKPDLDGFLYGFWQPGEMVFGVSPEILFRQKDSLRWATMAVAGTCAHEAYTSSPKSFLQDPKEVNEHERVVEFIRDQLADSGELHLGQRQALKAGSLVHLYTPIDFQSRSEFSFSQMIESLHPTPALGCYPRGDWRHFMGALSQDQKRWRYGAPFGVSWGRDKADVVVAIRNIQMQGDRWLLGSGCGIVPESQLDKEWQELSLKRSSVKNMLGL